MGPPAEVEKQPGPPPDAGKPVDPRDAWILELLADRHKPRRDPLAGRFDLLGDALTGGKLPAEKDDTFSQLQTLQSQRTKIEASLTPQQKQKLDECRIGLSQATTVDERARLRKEIDGIDPALAAINGKVRSELLSLSAADISATTRSRTEFQFPRRMSTIDCHRPPDSFREPPVDPAVAQAALRKQYLTLWRSIDDNWYAPYAGTCAEARRRGLSVEFERQDDKTTPRFFTGSDGDKKYLPLDGTRDLGRQVDVMVEAKLKELEGKYNVSFYRANEPVTKRSFNDGSGRFLPATVELRSRQPSLLELRGIESALEVSKCSFSGAKVKVGFLSQPTNSSYRPAGEYWSDLKGSPTIIMFADETLEQRQRYVGDDKVLETNAREVMIHEVAHHNQHRWGFWQDRQLIEDLGWKRSEAREQDWLLRGKKGEFYKVVPGEVGTSRNWMLVNKSGVAVDEAGKEVEKGKEIKIPQWNLREKLLVKPTSSYFDNACEMHAEAMMNFRAGGSRRAEMLENQHLYQIIKRHDQLEIDDYYQKNFPDKKGIRMPDGRIADRTPETTREVSDFEALMSTKVDVSKKLQDAYSARNDVSNDSFFGVTKPADHEAKIKKLIAVLDTMAPDIEVATKQKELLAKFSDKSSNSSAIRECDEARQMQANAYATYAAFLFTQGRAKEANEYLQKSIATDKLKSLSLPYASLKPADFAQFGQLTSLQELNISELPVTPEIAATIGKFSNLGSLSISRSPVTDASIEMISKIPNLKRLTLSAPEGITNKAFDHIANIKSLRELSIDGPPAAVSGKILKSVSTLPKLDYLSVRGVAGVDTSLSHLQNMPSLTRLELDLYSVSAVQPGSLKALTTIPNLTSLALSGPLSADNLKDLSGMPAVGSLSLFSQNNFGAGLSAIKTMPSLKYLHIYAGVDDAGVKLLEGAPSLEYINIDSKALKGDGLQVIKSLPKLTHFSAGNTKIGADSLSMIEGCPKLTYFYLGTDVAIPPEKIEALKQKLSTCLIDVRCYPPPPPPTAVGAAAGAAAVGAAAAKGADNAK